MSAAVQQVQAPAWDNVREQLRGLLGEETFGRWFQTVTASIEEENGVYMLQIAAPNRFQRDWLRDNYRSTIEGLWRNLEPDGTVVFTVRETPEPERNLPAKVIQFPLFPSETRPVSNDMARSALFACVQGKDRQMLEDALLATVEGVEIRFTGRQFNQDDHDLLIQLVFMAKHKPLGEYVTIPARAILKALGRTTGGKDYKRLEKDIERLVNSGVSLRDTRRKFKYIGHLIDDAAQDEASRYWAYKFNPRLRALYDPGMYTLVDWKQRQNLRGKDLARWLQLYLATHAAPFPVSVEYLHEKSGSRAKSLRHFREQLRFALDDLEDDTIRAIEAWEIDDNDLVHVKRGKAISDSQRRYLTTTKASRRRKREARV